MSARVFDLNTAHDVIAARRAKEKCALALAHRGNQSFVTGGAFGKASATRAARRIEHLSAIDNQELVAAGPIFVHCFFPRGHLPKHGDLIEMPVVGLLEH
jgi:hypothetical protein